MISFLRGAIIEKLNKSVIVITSNIGYEVFLSSTDWQNAQKNTEVEYYIYAQIKDDVFTLYGFKSGIALDFFKKLISVSGVGPKSAINILGLASVDDLKKAITSGDPHFLQQVSGIGKKTAERIVVELKEKFINDISAIAGASVSDRQVVEALQSLGYKEKEALEMVKNIGTEDTDLAERIKQALRNR